MSEIMVSITCLTYNHVKYIRRTLDGFLNQKTDFKYEILIHDDASTDGTADIIREYEKQYPDIIKPIYQTENQHSKKIGIQKTYQYPRAKGKYIAFCEGDDYWCDENKLQYQFDVMEKNKNVLICTHKVQIVNEQGQKLDFVYPNENLKIEKGEMDSKELIQTMLCRDGYPFHTSSYFVRLSAVLDLNDDLPEFYKKMPTGDAALLFYLLTKGNLYYINETYSCYRLYADGSWTSSMKNSRNMRKANIEKLIEGIKSFDEYTDNKYKDEVQVALERFEMRRFLAVADKKNFFASQNKIYRKKIDNKRKLILFLEIYFNSLFKILKKAKAFLECEKNAKQ